MNIQIFGMRKSFDTKKAERWFKERRIKYQYIDLEAKGLSAGEYRSVKAAVGYDALVNRSCAAYEELYMDYITPQAAEEKLLAYLFDQAKQQGSAEFVIPCERQALADYLGVERTAMSAEISKLKKAGVLDTKGSWFCLKNVDQNN